MSDTTPTVVLVHAAFAGSAGLDRLIERLRAAEAAADIVDSNATV